MKLWGRARVVDQGMRGGKGKPHQVVLTPEQHRKKTEGIGKKRPVVLVGTLEALDVKEAFRVLRRLGFSTYKAYLRSPLWAEIRGRVLRRDKGRCSYCGGKGSQVHHEAYTWANLEGKSLEWLVTACNDCHRDRHHLDLKDSS